MRTRFAAASLILGAGGAQPEQRSQGAIYDIQAIEAEITFLKGQKIEAAMLEAALNGATPNDVEMSTVGFDRMFRPKSLRAIAPEAPQIDVFMHLFPARP